MIWPSLQPLSEALRTYRGHVDGQARRRLEQALATRDEALLRRVAEETFCSRPAEMALDALGELCERKDTDERVKAAAKFAMEQIRKPPAKQ